MSRQKRQISSHIGLHCSTHPFVTRQHQTKRVNARAAVEKTASALVVSDVVNQCIVACGSSDDDIADTRIDHIIAGARGDGLITVAGCDGGAASPRRDGVVAIARSDDIGA